MAQAPEAAHLGGKRDEILDAIRARPGASVSDVARSTGIAHSTATYHLRRLETLGFLLSEREGGRLHYFLNGQALPRERALAICRKSRRSEEILRRLPADRPVPLGAVAAGMPMTKAGVLWHLGRLVALGLVVAEGHAGARRYRAAAEGG